MKLLRRLAKVAPLLLAACVGSAATVWSPISCSCLSAWEDVATGLDRFDIDDPNQLTAPFIAHAIKEKFSGKSISARDLPFATSTADCMEIRGLDKDIYCTWWLWESGTQKKGYDVHVLAAPEGTFRRVIVTPIISWSAR